MPPLSPFGDVILAIMEFILSSARLHTFCILYVYVPAQAYLLNSEQSVAS